MRSLSECKAVLKDNASGPALISTAKDSFNWALGYRSLSIRLRMESTGESRAEAAKWCADGASKALEALKICP